MGKKPIRILIGVFLFAFAFTLGLWLNTNGVFSKNPTMRYQPVNAYEETIRVVTDEDYRPFSYWDADGNLVGYDIETVTLLANRLNVNLELRAMRWNDVLEAVRRGEADVVMTCEATFEGDNAGGLIYTCPTYTDVFSVYGKEKAQTVLDLRDKKIAVSDNSCAQKLIDAYGIRNNMVEYSYSQDVVKAVAEGECDCFIMRRTVGEALIKNNGFTNISEIMTVGNSFMCYGVAEGREDLVERLNAEIQNLSDNGMQRRLEHKWITSYLHRASFIEFVKEFAPLFIAGIVLLFVIAVCVIASGYRKSVRASVRRLHERDQMLSGMAEDYDAIFVADLNSRKVSTIRYTEDSRKAYGKKSKIINISDILERLRINVHPDDIAALEKALQDPDSVLSDERAYFIDYRTMRGDQYRYYQMKLIRAESEDDAEKPLLIGFRNVDASLREEKERGEALKREVNRQAAIIRAEADRYANVLRDVIEGMATLVESRDLTTGEHVERTRRYVTMIINRLKTHPDFAGMIDDEYAMDVSTTSVLHDIGKIFVSDFILNKPGKLTPDEFEIIKTHTTFGARIVDEIFSNRLNPFTMAVLRDIVFHHHEKWNGSGYPEGLSGDDIPLAARVMAVADVFDAVTSKRPYKSTIDLDKAFDILVKDSGSHFDKRIVDVFVEMRPEVEAFFESTKGQKKENALGSIAGTFGNFERKLQQESIISGLAKDYEAVFYAEPDMNRVSILRQNEKSLFYDDSGVDGLMKVMTYEEFLNMGKRYVHPADRTLFDRAVSRETIREQFADGDASYLTFRSWSGREESYYEMKLMRLGKATDDRFDILIGLHDISESEKRKARERDELNEAKRQAETANAVKTEFVYKISHDLRTPINDIVGFTDLAIRYADNRETSMGYLEKAKLSEGTLLSVVDRILQVQNIDMQTGETVPENRREATEAGADAGQILNGLKVLLVEDNELNMEIARMIIEENGAIVDVAEDGSVALQKISSSPSGTYDLVFMDVQMPVMDGIEATKRIRKLDDPALSSIPIIAMTANAFKSDKRAVIEAGMNAFIAKPIDVNELVNTVHAQLSDRKKDAFVNDGIGSWAIEIDPDRDARFYADDELKRLLGFGGNDSPEDTYLGWNSRIDSGSEASVRECMERMKNGEFSETRFAWNHPDQGKVELMLDGIRSFSYTAGIRLEGSLRILRETLPEKPVIAKTEVKSATTGKPGIVEDIFDWTGFKKQATAILDENRKNGVSTIVMYVDISDLRAINEKYGNDAGDECISAVMKCVTSVISDQGVAGRLGSDEFAVITDCDGSESCEKFFHDRINERVKEYNAEKSKPYQIAVTIGSIVVHPEDGASIYEALISADEVVYKVKTDS